MSQSIRQERSLCHNSFWKYVKHLFDNNTTKRINPAFAEDKAFPFFKPVYSSQPKSFHQPPGMPSAKDPVFNFNESPFSIEEIRSTIIRSNASSTPSPLDQIPYRILKRCLFLVHALFKLYNQCWQTSTIPQAWKTASIRLIAKGSAKDDPSSPSNFRPIALTSCIRKIFTSILKSRWSTYMLENEYLDPFHPNGLHEGNTWLHRTPSYVGLDTCQCKKKTQISDSCLARSGKCVWQCPPFIDRFCSASLSCSITVLQCYGLSLLRSVS